MVIFPDWRENSPPLRPFQYNFEVALLRIKLTLIIKILPASILKGEKKLKSLSTCHRLRNAMLSEKKYFQLSRR